MSEISDELREWSELLKCSAYTNTTAKKINTIADRMDAEMVELPKGADGKPIHIGDTLYDLDGYEHTAVSLHLYGEEDLTWTVSVGGGSVYPRNLTHKRPDSLERIADEIEKADVDGCIDCADRIRKLAKERGDE